MKKYKNWVPLILVIVMGLSVYSLVNNTLEKKKSNEKYLATANEFRKDGIVEDAVENYKKALSITKNIDVAMEIGNVYLENNYSEEALRWGETLVEEYPKEIKAYIFLLQQYVKEERYEDCFVLNDITEGRKIANDEFKNIIQTIKYKFAIDFSEYEQVSTFGDGYCAVSENDKWGYVNEQGTMTVSCIYTQADTYFDDYAAVQDENREWYYINTEGNKKKAVKNLKSCTYLGSFYDDKLVACDSNEYAYYNKNFEKLSDSFTYASALNGDIGAVDKDGEWSLVNSKGEILTGNKYEEFVLDDKKIAYRNGRAFGKRNDLYYMIDENGKEIKTEVLQEAKLFLPGSDVTAVKVGDKWGFIDTKGKMVIEAQYQDARPFSNELAAVMVNGKWGFIDTDGKMVIEPQFEDVKDFNTQGRVFVSEGSGWRLLKLLKDNH